MKKSFLFIALLLGLTGCPKPTTPKITPDENIDINIETNTGDLGAFHLIGPVSGIILEKAVEFSWEESANADKYTLEICSSEYFISDLDNIDYYSQENILATSFKINSEFQFKDTTYYWRVTSYNGRGHKECAEVFNFFVKAPEVEEVYFDFGEADDWKLHPVGSPTSKLNSLIEEDCTKNEYVDVLSLLEPEFFAVTRQ